MLHQSEILPKTIKPQHIDGVIVIFGVAADRPDGSSHVKAYFATDSGVLSMWDGDEWLDTTLS